MHRGRNSFDHPRNRRGLTLVETLIAIAIVAVLCVLAVPVFQKVQSSSRSVTCQSNLRQIAVGMTQYANEHNNWMPPHLETVTMPGGARVYPKWYAWIAPYMTSWDGKNPTTTPMDKVFYCPSNPRPYDPAMTYYGPLGKSDFSYGYNARFLTSQKNNGFTAQLPMRRTSVLQPARLVLVTDIPNQDATGERSVEGWRQIKAGWLHPSATTIADWHNQGSNILFLDGHLESRRGDDILGKNYDPGNWNPYTQTN